LLHFYSEAIGDVQQRIPLAELQERPWPAAVFRRHPPSPANTGGVVSSRYQRHDLLDAYVMLPAIGEVVLAQEALPNAEPQVSQPYLMWIVAKAEAAEVADAVLATVNHEAVEVLVAPVQSDLQRGMQVGSGAVATDEQSAPDQWADAAQDDAQLVHDRLGDREALRHRVIIAALAVSPVALPRFFPLSLLARRLEDAHAALRQILDWIDTLPFDADELAQIAAAASIGQSATVPIDRAPDESISTNETGIRALPFGSDCLEGRWVAKPSSRQFGPYVYYHWRDGGRKRAKFVGKVGRQIA
jgi:hypothetical protein